MGVCIHTHTDRLVNNRGEEESQVTGSVSYHASSDPKDFQPCPCSLSRADNVTYHLHITMFCICSNVPAQQRSEDCSFHRLCQLFGSISFGTGTDVYLKPCQGRICQKEMNTKTITGAVVMDDTNWFEELNININTKRMGLCYLEKKTKNVASENIIEVHENTVL